MKYPALKITIIYILIGVTWILLSDKVLNLILSDPSQVQFFQHTKGVFYVLVTALILYLLMRNFYSRQQSSREEYERIFMEFTHPMWIYDVESLRIILANKAAAKNYQYSHWEFQQLRITDIRPSEEVGKLKRQLAAGTTPFQNSGVWKHRRKNAEEFYAEVFGSSIKYNDMQARLVLAIDVNESILAQQKIIDQNERLSKIAHFQAHNLRGPLASILGLISIVDFSGEEPGKNREVLENLKIASQQLDEVIREIVETTQEDVISRD